MILFLLIYWYFWVKKFSSLFSKHSCETLWYPTYNQNLQIPKGTFCSRLIIIVSTWRKIVYSISRDNGLSLLLVFIYGCIVNVSCWHEHKIRNTCPRVIENLPNLSFRMVKWKLRLLLRPVLLNFIPGMIYVTGSRCMYSLGSRISRMQTVWQYMRVWHVLKVRSETGVDNFRYENFCMCCEP